MPRNVPTFGANNLRRPYDDFMSAPALKAARSLRKDPTGDVHELKHVSKGGRLVPQYPWKKMELGDMFFAPIGDRSPKAMRVGFQQAAARNDIEICVIGTKDRSLPENPKDSSVTHLRVSVTAIGIANAKQLAFEAGYTPHAPLVGDRLEKRISEDKARRAAASKKRYAVVGYKPKKAVQGPIEAPPSNPFNEPRIKAQSKADRDYEVHKKHQQEQGYDPDAVDADPVKRREQIRAFALRNSK